MSWPSKSKWNSGKYAPPAVTSLAVYGGIPIERHYRALRQPPLIVIGTPGRLLDVAGTRHLDLRGVEYVVMDEADQMLDRGFLRDIQRILKLLPEQRQTMLFSATFSPEILTLAESMLKNPARTSVDPGVNTPTTITHAYYVVPSESSRVQLIHTLIQQAVTGDQSMVFCDQKYKVKRLAARLGGEPASVGAITGNHSQAQRETHPSRHSDPGVCDPWWRLMWRRADWMSHPCRRSFIMSCRVILRRTSIALGEQAAPNGPARRS